MPDDRQMQQRFTKLYKAFLADGFQIKKRAYAPSGNMGLMAEHKTARNYDAGNKKTSYYLEGTPYERGYLMGLLAEPEISDMATTFVDRIVFDFFGLDFLNRFLILQKLLVTLLHELSKSAWASQPRHVHEEARGILDGCQKSNPKTRVTRDRIIVMNVGFDVLCALIYTGRFLRERIPGLAPEHIRLTMMCNAFSVFGGAAAGGHFFARDFMFANGGVLQKNLAHVLCRPEVEQAPDEKLYPYVSIAAPGMIGSIGAMNINGVAGGLNMSPAANCDPDRIGMNSTLLLRESILKGGSAAEAAQVIRNAERGVSWNYIFSDGKNDAACTVEAGASWPDLDFLSFPPPALLPYLPDAAFLSSHNPSPVQNGAMVRWHNIPFPETYFAFNPGLWQYYKTTYDPRIRLHPDAFSPAGFINRTREEKNCPSSFYFAPQRTEGNVFITTNHFLLPHMRLCAMDPWTALVVRAKVNDIQWRYDELNHQIRQTILREGHIDYRAAKRLADFLAPYGNFPEYYRKNEKSRDGKEISIEGCVSLFDLKNQTVESHYGYYGDEWVKTTLPAYF